MTSSYVRKALKQQGETPRQRGGQAPITQTRRAKVHVGAYLPHDFRSAIRMLQAATGEDLQTILARALNEQFRRHNLPEVEAS